MKLSDYIKDKYFSIIMSICSILITFILLIITNANIIVVFAIMFILIIFSLITYIYDYSKKKVFFDKFSNILVSLDKKYLVTEVIKDSSFIEGKLLLDYLCEIDKCMHENINQYKYSIDEFREYLDMWCHEIKTPIAVSKLVIDNNKNEITSSILEEINKIDSYVEQVLFYSRSETVEKDYIINKTNLKDIINDVIKRNKKLLINKKIKVENNINSIVNTDTKWIEFILNQIIQNSIKYSKDIDSKIIFNEKVNKNNIILTIEDNGIGIKSEEIDKIFNKGFTGSNGRKKYNSTGIGLYLCRKLCVKLGLDIFASSKENEYTKVSIVFPDSSMTNNKEE